MLRNVFFWFFFGGEGDCLFIYLFRVESNGVLHKSVVFRSTQENSLTPSIKQGSLNVDSKLKSKSNKEEHACLVCRKCLHVLPPLTKNIETSKNSSRQWPNNRFLIGFYTYVSYSLRQGTLLHD